MKPWLAAVCALGVARAGRAPDPPSTPPKRQTEPQAASATAPIVPATPPSATAETPEALDEAAAEPEKAAEPPADPSICAAGAQAPLDLTRALDDPACRQPVSGGPARAARGVAVSAAADKKTVRAGDYVRIRITFTNQGTAAARLVFYDRRQLVRAGGDRVSTPGFDVMAHDMKGRSVDIPANMGLLGMLTPPQPADRAEIELAPGTHAEATVWWRASGFDPKKRYSGSGVLSPEPLPPGKYRLTIGLPLVGAGKEPSVVVAVRP